MPFTGSWHPLAVAWGIVGMYLLVAIEITSLLRHRMSKRAWHAVHLLSYLLFATTTVHMLTAGTDVKALVASSAAVLLGVAVTFGSRGALPVAERARRRRRVDPALRSSQRRCRLIVSQRFGPPRPREDVSRQRAGAVPRPPARSPFCRGPRPSRGLRRVPASAGHRVGGATALRDPDHRPPPEHARADEHQRHDGEGDAQRARPAPRSGPSCRRPRSPTTRRRRAATRAAPGQDP